MEAEESSNFESNFLLPGTLVGPTSCCQNQSVVLISVGRNCSILCRALTSHINERQPIPFEVYPSVVVGSLTNFLICVLTTWVVACSPVVRCVRGPAMKTAKSHERGERAVIEILDLRNNLGFNGKRCRRCVPFSIFPSAARLSTHLVFAIVRTATEHLFLNKHAL